jgi:hypothetical protein
MSGSTRFTAARQVQPDAARLPPASGRAYRRSSVMSRRSPPKSPGS